MGVAPCERMGDEFALPLSLSVADRGVPPENRTNLTRDEGSPPVLSWKARPTL